MQMQGSSVMSEAEWQPIEKAPKDGKRILLWAYWAGLSDVEIGAWLAREWRLKDGRSPARPTHWMPLPFAPEDTSDAE